MKHRADIDGLRAIAVLPITFFHAGIPGFAGGFVGVDIFFVISGFLITGILVRDLEAGCFSYADFYERRLRRIFPALIVMLAASLLAAYFLILPSELRSFGRSVIGAIVFVANIVFYREAGYFDDSAEEKPLLHTWSLGVEEQFYIVFPIILFTLMRYLPRHRGAATMGLTAVSLGLCVALTPRNPDAAFYLIPTRAWELLAGSLLALGCSPRLAQGPAREGLALGGLALILGSIFLFGSEMAFPGYVAIAPVLGSALVIGYAQGTPVECVLSIKPFVFVGSISYSLYLWHWPIIVFGNKASTGEAGIEIAIVFVVVSLIAGYLSYRFVETPFRNRGRFTRKSIFIGSLAIAGALLALTSVGLAVDLGQRQFSRQMIMFDSAREDVSPHRDRCHPSSGLAAPEDACVLGDAQANTAVWGDSHGVELAYSLYRQGHAIRSMTYSSCPPAIGVEIIDRPDCSAHNSVVLNYLLDQPGIANIVMAAYFPGVVNKPDTAAGMRESVRRLVAANRNVFIVAPTPHEANGDLPRRLVRTGDFSISKAQYETRNSETIAFLGRLKKEGATILWPADYLCAQGQCSATIEGRPVLFDSHHTSQYAADFLAKRFASVIWPDDTGASQLTPAQEGPEHIATN